MQHARLFLAFELDAEVRRRLGAAITAMQRVLPPARWCKPDALHITLMFFGTLPLTSVREIDLAVQSVSEGQAPFACEVKGMGGFPSLERPRVLWAGIGEGAAPLTSCATAVMAACAACGFGREERGFVPHITLARLRQRKVVRSETLQRAVPDAHDKSFGITDVNRITLFSSELTASGPRYAIVATWSFGAGRAEQ